MSSILEALRELEGRRPPAGPSVAHPVDPPSTVNRAAETFGIVALGFVLGAIGFVLFLALSGVIRTRALPEAAPPAAAPNAAAPARPGWLDTAEPPRARVGPGVPGSAGAAPSPRAATARPEPEADRPAARTGGPPAGRVEVEAIHFTEDAARRAVTLRLDGSVVRLRQRESARGIEVQLIERDNVYVRRGAEVFAVAPER